MGRMVQFFYFIKKVNSFVPHLGRPYNGPNSLHELAMNPAYLAYAALGLIWGTNFIFMKWASVYISASQIVFLRLLFGFVPILIVALFTGALKWRQLRHAHHFFVMSLLATSVYYYAFARGTALLLSSVAGMLSGAIPLFAFVCAWVLLRQERPTARMTLGIVCGFFGVLLIAQPWNAGNTGVNLAGVLYVVAGSLSVGCSFVYARRFLSGLDISPLALTTWQIGFGLIAITCVSDFHGMMRVTSDVRAATGLVLGLGVLGTGVAYILYYFIVRRLGAIAASSVTYIPPVVALVLGLAIGGESIKPLDLLAMLAILGGVFLLQSRRQAKPTLAPPHVSKA
jgi:drug/metabolite transporter (DMT)-like permease